MADRRVKRVTQIPKIQSIEDGYAFRKKVAAYARVSTGSEEQETSLFAQRTHYEEYIKANPEWVFMGIYYDDGISGLSYRNRDGFNQMIADAEAGKIDLILTKSLSRFARNTVDTLVVIRKLKEKGVGVYFEKEDIDTLDAKGEFLITLMSSLAQEESRSISENVAWGRRKRYADGEFSMAFKNFLGLDKAPDGTIVINEEQAKVVRLIYRLYLVGFTEFAIAKMLERLESVHKPGGPKWHTNVIINVLQNEKYKGDVLLQKTFTVDFLTKKTKINEGELPQYYLEKVLPAIVSDEVHELAQQERKQRQEWNKSYSCLLPLSGRIVCGNCGSFYGRKQSHKSYKQLQFYSEFWICNRFYDYNCKTAKPRFEVVEGYFRRALKSLFEKYTEVVSICEKVATEVISQRIGRRSRAVLYMMLDMEQSLAHYAMFQRFTIDEILICGETSMTFRFIDGSEFVYPLKRNKQNQIV